MEAPARPAGHAPAAMLDPGPLPPLAWAAPIDREAPRLPLPRLTLEHGLYALLILLAVLTRFWDLGSRTLHHDESLHTYYSWLFTTGQGYVHDPLMHGPFLFHAVALGFLLFGDSDVTGRIMPAIFGVALVGLPYLLRGPRFLGRWGALIASGLLLVSPALLYQSRYLRHDIFTVVGTLLLVIAILRYIERPERRWLITIGIVLACLTANHEIIFGLLLVFGGVLGLALLWGRLRPLTPVVVATGVAFVASWLVLPRALDRPLPTIPWQNPSGEDQIEFYRALLTNPAPLSSLLVLVLGGVAAALVLRRRNQELGRTRWGQGWIPATFGDASPGSVEHAVYQLWLDRTGLAWMIGLYVVISIVLFTSLFTNLYGLATATFATDGTLLYWLGQHDYQRGEQPWFYYLVLMPQYELIAVLFGLAAAALIGVRALVVAVGRRRPGPRFFFQFFLLAWFGGILAGLSWAGEKMPWLVNHISLPATLLAAALLGELADRRWRWAARAGAGARRLWALPEAGLTAALLVIGAGWFLLAARLTAGEWVPASATGGWERAMTPWAAERWWWLALPPLAALALIGAGLARRGARRTGPVVLLSTVVLLVGLQVHLAWRLVYQEGDVPRDMMVYTQTSPDVSRMMRELSLLSAELTGGNDLEIWYDDNQGVSWPLQWYLRDYPNRNMFGSSLSAAPPSSVAVLIVGTNRDAGVAPFMAGYTAQEYVLRWWFPESVYRDFAMAPDIPPGRSAWKDADNPPGLRDIAGSIGESLGTLGTMEGQQRLFRLLMFRDLPEPIGRFTYTIYVRDDLVPLFNTLRY